MTEPQELQSVDLETVDCYMVVCWECKRATTTLESENDALANATEEGFRVLDDSVYCPVCIPLIQQRLEEEDEADREWPTHQPMNYEVYP